MAWLRARATFLCVERARKPECTCARLSARARACLRVLNFPDRSSVRFAVRRYSWQRAPSAPSLAQTRKLLAAAPAAAAAADAVLSVQVLSHACVRVCACSLNFFH